MPEAIVRGRRILSFFTGAGGLDLGFEQAGFETIYATDLDKDSCATLRMNSGHSFRSDLIVECADIFTIDPRRLPPNIDLVIGGPPCQSFSASGRRAGGAAGRLDERGNLFQAYCNIIKHVRPAAFVFENVRGILATNKGDDWKAITDSFAKLGYKTSYRLLDALDYGTPQQRERMFLVGHQLEKPFLFPEPTHGPDSLTGRPHITSSEALQGVIHTEDLANLLLTGGKYSHLLPLVPPGQNYLFFTAKRGYPRPIFAYRSRFSDFLYKASPDHPIKTLIASPGKYTGPLHWENRYFSVAEYKRLQGFPDDYKFAGNRDDIIRQIGNSVSPKIAYQIALAIADQVFGCASPVRLMDNARVLSFDKRKGIKARTTRTMHAEVASLSCKASEMFFSPGEYSGRAEPSSLPQTHNNVIANFSRGKATLTVSGDNSTARFAKMVLHLRQSSKVERANVPELTLSVEAFGESPATAQLMWNAVDDWVRRSSDFHSLFELYGHFTEPHPLFRVSQFDVYSDHPIAHFAAHAANFSNCSQYFPKSHLIGQFSNVLGTNDFGKISSYLRSWRFDIRSKETNIAIRDDVYMVAYPFNLPSRRQMNFRVREIEHRKFAKAG